MKKYLIPVLILVVAIVLLFPILQNEVRWHRAKSANERQGYLHYLFVGANEKHIGEARLILDEMDWQIALTSDRKRDTVIEPSTPLGDRTQVSFPAYMNTGEKITDPTLSFPLHPAFCSKEKRRAVQDFQQYLRRHGTGLHATEARDSLQTNWWSLLVSFNTIRGYNLYCEMYPQGSHYHDAIERRTALQNDVSVFDQYVSDKNIFSVSRFIEEFPGHIRMAEAQRIYEELKSKQPSLPGIDY